MVSLVSVATRNNITAVVGYVDGEVKHKIICKGIKESARVLQDIATVMKVIVRSIPDTAVIEVDFPNKPVLRLLDENIDGVEDIESVYNSLLDLQAVPAVIEQKYTKAPQALVYCKEDYIPKSKMVKMGDILNEYK